MIAPRTAFSQSKPRFQAGQLVRHLRYNYRGVVVAVDRSCQASDAWYAQNQTQPDRQQPWYHVLVDGSSESTYAAESNLSADTSTECVVHPWINAFFSEFTEGRYRRNQAPWPYPAP